MRGVITAIEVVTHRQKNGRAELRGEDGITRSFERRDLVLWGDFELLGVNSEVEFETRSRWKDRDSRRACAFNVRVVPEKPGGS
jgi:hypothetical protein